MQVDLDRRIAALKLAEQFLHLAGAARRRHEADFDAPHFTARRLLRGDFGFIDLSQDIARPSEQPDTGFRHFDVGVSVALEQLGAELALEFLDLMRERRRADLQPQGGTGKMLLLREHHEIAKQPGFNVAHSLDAI